MMEVKGVSNVSLGRNPQIKAIDDFGVDTKEQKVVKDEKEAEKYKVPSLVIGTALAAATISGAIVHGRMNRALKYAKSSYQHHIDNLERPFRQQIDGLNRRLESITNENTGLKEKNKNLANINAKIDAEREKILRQFDRIFGEDLTPEETRTNLYNRIRAKIVSGKLDYDPMEPPVVGKLEEGARDMSKAYNLPPRVPTTNRSHIRKLEIPEIKEDGSFEFKLPMSDEVKVSSMPSRDFKPIKDQMTTVSEGYADSVQWDNNKIARDILQNFYDGHGQTLDGVRMRFEPIGEGRYRVRIEGDSSYTVDKAIFMGESTKREDMKAAGNYGEGLKMASLKLIKDKGAKNVKIGSDNWDLTFKLMKSDLTDRQVMAFDIDKSAKKAGNYIEFETDDRALLDTFRTTINRFYHSGNEHFKCPDFENDLFGIKLLNPRKCIGYSTQKGDKGAFYIAGQRFEYEGDYDGLEGAIIFLKEKPPKNILDPSRDRTTLNEGDLRNIGRWIEGKMTDKERVDFIQAMEPSWKKKSYDEMMPIDDMFSSFLISLKYGRCSESTPLLINFPKDKYVAYSDSTPELCDMLRQKGYTICKEEFHSLGMQSIKELMGDARAHDPVTPDTLQVQKIKIIKEAIKKLAPGLKRRGEGSELTHFTPAEIDTKIYIFNNKGAKDKKISGDALAEAIIDRAESKGFWIDSEYLNKGDFSDVLETALHELSHKAGGDETMEFSYKLTDVNRHAIKEILNNPEVRFELRTLNELWNKLSAEAQIAA